MGLAVDQLVSCWRRSLRQRTLAPRTIQTYVESATQLAGWLVDRGVTDVDEVTRDHVAGFITHLIESTSPSTASVRFRALQQFLGWLAGEGELTGPNSMEKMRPPMVPDRPVPVLTVDQLRARSRACPARASRTGAMRRSCGVRDTGLRPSELAHLAVADVDLDEQVAVVLGKGRRPRAVPFRAKTTAALDRYLRGAASAQAGSRGGAVAGARQPVGDDGERHRPDGPPSGRRDRHPRAARLG